MKKMINEEHISGRVYESELEIKQVKNASSPNFGKDFITGTLHIATDEACLNIVPVHFTYVTEKTNAGKANATFAVLKKFVEGAPTILTHGKDVATKVTVDTALALNEWYDDSDQLISVKRNESGFVKIVSELNPDEKLRNKFTVDMVITNVTHKDADPEKGIENDYTILRGAIFNFKGDLLPIDFKVTDQGGMQYFENLDVSPAVPVFTKVWGPIVSETVKKQTTEESAFGQAIVNTVESKHKEWIVAGTLKTPYDFGDEKILDAESLKTAMQNREVALAELKKRSDEYKMSKAAASAPNANAGIGATVASNGAEFKF